MAKTAIIGALEEEVVAIQAQMCVLRTHHIARRSFCEGTLFGVPVVVAGGRLGKVAAAATAAILLQRFAVERVIMVGFGGAVDPELELGDVVLADSLLHHDLDLSPHYSRYTVPLLDLQVIPTDPDLTSTILTVSDKERVHRGLVVSGDCFLKQSEALQNLQPKCVDVEGAAVAQVCYEFEIDFALIRVISHKVGSQTAATDHNEFLENLPNSKIQNILEHFLRGGN